MERDLCPTIHFLCGSDPRIAETGPHVKGKCTAANAAALDMRSVSRLYCWQGGRNTPARLTIKFCPIFHCILDFTQNLGRCLDFTPRRQYFVSSFAKSIDNPEMKKDYGAVLFGYKGDRIADLLSPLYTVTPKRTRADKVQPFSVFSQMVAYDVLYDTDELIEEFNYLFSVIDLFHMTDNDKNDFLNSFIQYWLLSAKDPKWATERERRYVLFLYDDYDYNEMRIEDGYLKLKTSLFTFPDFVIGSHPEKDAIGAFIDNKRKAISYKSYMFCRNCLNRDYDVVTDFEKNDTCPVCSSRNIEIITLN